jgi:hypothetical protein
VVDWTEKRLNFCRIWPLCGPEAKAFEVDELPEDVLENDDYVEIPNRYDFDLGKELVWEFVDRQIPGLKNKVQEIFSRRGAYARYKAFLEDLDLLDAWYRFENERTKEVLLEWCSDKGIPIEG